MEETVEAPVVEEVEAAEEADVQDWEGMEKRIKNLEDAIADLKSRDGEKEDFNSEVELSAKPIKHNPESKGEVKMNLFSQNKQMTTQDRVFAKLFNN